MWASSVTFLFSPFRFVLILKIVYQRSLFSFYYFSVNTYLPVKDQKLRVLKLPFPGHSLPLRRSWCHCTEQIHYEESNSDGLLVAVHMYSSHLSLWNEIQSENKMLVQPEVLTELDESKILDIKLDSFNFIPPLKIIQHIYSFRQKCTLFQCAGYTL